MKKIFSFTGFFLPLMALWLAGCKAKPAETAQEPVTIGPADTLTPAPVFSDSVGAEGTASTSLDVAGDYEGVLPCTDCKGLKTTLKLTADKSYSISGMHQGKQGAVPVNQSGSWNWVNGNVILLNNCSQLPARYFISEGRVIQLDSNGTKIRTENADAYSLAKKPTNP